MAGTMEHDQEKYEAYCNQEIPENDDINWKPALKNCECEDCLEELRYLTAQFYAEMGLPIPKTIKV
mgnify:CR=1 FL=1